MKKTLSVAALFIVFATSLASCKKDYVCNCSKTYTSGSTTVTSDYSSYTYKDTRSRAEDRCNANTTSGKDLLGNYSINCQIK